MYGAFRSIVTKPECTAEVKAFLVEDGAWSLVNESGTVRFDVYQDQEDPARVWVYEAYADPEAFQAHRGGASFAKFFDDILPRCSASAVERSMRWSYSIE